MKKLLAFFSLLFAFTILKADVGIPYSDYYDSLPVSERHFDSAQISLYEDDSDFDYNRSSIEAPSYLDRFIRWLFEKTVGQAKPEWVGLTLDILMWVILAIALGLVLYFSFKADGAKLFGKRKPQNNAVQFMDFQGEESQLDEELVRAEELANYPLALRLLFIKTLQTLKQAGLLNWKKEKTNGDYMRELKDELQKTPFSRLSHLFEFVHYGQYAMKEEDYAEAKALFLQLRRSLKGGPDER